MTKIEWKGKRTRERGKEGEEDRERKVERKTVRNEKK